MESTDIKYYKTFASGEGIDSLGGATTATLLSGSLHELFDYVSPEEASAGDTEYRAIDVKNIHASETLYGAVAYISTPIAPTTSNIAIGYDSTGTQSVANESTAPSTPAISFSTATTKATGIALGGDMAPGVTKRIWVRLAVNTGAAKTLAAGQITVEGGGI